MHEFIKYLRKSVENRRGKPKEDACERILGLNGKVNEFAAFYEQHEEDLFIAIAVILEKFQRDKTYTVEEMAIYRLALSELPLFMAACKDERDRKHDEDLAKMHKKLAEDREVITQ